MAAWAFAIANLKNVDETVISSRKNDVKKLHCYNPLKMNLIFYIIHTKLKIKRAKMFIKSF